MGSAKGSEPEHEHEHEHEPEHGCHEGAESNCSRSIGVCLSLTMIWFQAKTEGLARWHAQLQRLLVHETPRPAIAQQSYCDSLWLKVSANQRGEIVAGWGGVKSQNLVWRLQVPSRFLLFGSILV